LTRVRGWDLLRHARISGPVRRLSNDERVVPGSLSLAMSTSQPSLPEPDDHPGNRITEAILRFLSHVPSSDESESLTPARSARSVANLAAAKAATAAGAFALPPGPLGWLTILPELATVWKIQGQMVADIAGIYGKSIYLSREQMVYCLFRHAAAQAVRDLVVRVGERYLVKQVSLKAFETIAKKVGIKVTQHAVGKGLSRWMPVIGALGVGAYAYYDTAQVAKTAIELFESEIEMEEAPEVTPPRKGPPPLPEVR